MKIEHMRVEHMAVEGTPLTPDVSDAVPLEEIESTITELPAEIHVELVGELSQPAKKIGRGRKSKS